MPEARCEHKKLPQTVSCPCHLAQPVLLHVKQHGLHGKHHTPPTCRSGPGLRHALQLRTMKNTAWQPYKPSESALQHLAYRVHPRQQVQLAELHPEMIGSNVDMTCVLLWAGAIGKGRSSAVACTGDCVPECTCKSHIMTASAVFVKLCHNLALHSVPVTPLTVPLHCAFCIILFCCTDACNCWSFRACKEQPFHRFYKDIVHA